MEHYTKADFIRTCFRDCLKDGQPHNFKELLEYVQKEAMGTPYEGKIDRNTLGVYCQKILNDPAQCYNKLSRGVYQKGLPKGELGAITDEHMSQLYELYNRAHNLALGILDMHHQYSTEFPQTAKSLSSEYRDMLDGIGKCTSALNFWIAGMENPILDIQTEQNQEEAEEPEEAEGFTMQM